MSMKLCPVCGHLAVLNSYFGAYICNNCWWEDDSPNRERVEFRKRFHEIQEKVIKVFKGGKEDGITTERH